MTLKQILNDLLKVVLEEAGRNVEFSNRLEDVLLKKNKLEKKISKPPSRANDTSIYGDYGNDSNGELRRASNRRSPAILDPVQIARDDPDGLRTQLAGLRLDQLHDIVAEYGMDTGKLVMKWKDTARIIDRIIEVSLARAQKGNAFRAQPDTLTSTKNSPMPED